MNPSAATYVRVGREDFDVQTEYQALCDQGSSGAAVIFTGLVRDLEGGATVSSLELQHYPGMTERVLQNIAHRAGEQWTLGSVRIIHRVGRLAPDEQIVFVGVASQHRAAAFQACEYLMDRLKTEAPFWKKIETADGNAHWVEARESDAEAARRWLSGLPPSPPLPQSREPQSRDPLAEGDPGS